MKVIDLLNKIANGEEVPKNIKYVDREWFWCESCKIYEQSSKEANRSNLYRYFAEDGDLNDEVEIVEEDKNIIPICPFDDLNIEEEKEIPKKIPLTYADNRSKEEVYEYLRCTINKIIDFIKENR